MRDILRRLLGWKAGLSPTSPPLQISLGTVTSPGKTGGVESPGKFGRVRTAGDITPLEEL